MPCQLLFGDHYMCISALNLGRKARPSTCLWPVNPPTLVDDQLCMRHLVLFSWSQLSKTKCSVFPCFFFTYTCFSSYTWTPTIAERELCKNPNGFLKSLVSWLRERKCHFTIPSSTELELSWQERANWSLKGKTRNRRCTCWNKGWPCLGSWPFGQTFKIAASASASFNKHSS